MHWHAAGGGLMTMLPARNKSIRQGSSSIAHRPHWQQAADGCLRPAVLQAMAGGRGRRPAATAVGGGGRLLSITASSLLAAALPLPLDFVKSSRRECSSIAHSPRRNCQAAGCRQRSTAGSSLPLRLAAAVGCRRRLAAAAVGANSAALLQAAASVGSGRLLPQRDRLASAALTGLAQPGPRGPGHDWSGALVPGQAGLAAALEAVGFMNKADFIQILCRIYAICAKVMPK